MNKRSEWWFKSPQQSICVIFNLVWVTYPSTYLWGVLSKRVLLLSNWCVIMCITSWNDNVKCIQYTVFIHWRCNRCSIGPYNSIYRLITTYFKHPADNHYLSVYCFNKILSGPISLTVTSGAVHNVYFVNTICKWTLLRERRYVAHRVKILNVGGIFLQGGPLEHHLLQKKKNISHRGLDIAFVT